MAAQERRRRRVARFWRALVLALVAASVIQELRKDPADREWHDSLFGVVPYDFRRPTAARFRAAVWSPDDPRLLTPRAYGVGWTLNFGRLVRLVTRPD
ncbi:MAG: hypothetical protein JO368_11985 [Acidimicrobiales bacterium]|nr:hypothetical protein [Acidimicrobiales bacterium]